jgi:CubicO group peptidase (beta-lactamase class C family)
MFMRPLAIVIGVAFCAGGSLAQSNSKAAAIDAYLQPYVHSGNFAGDVLVEKNGKVVFEKAYGFADKEHRIRNIAATRFHIASMSMQFTAAAILRLVDAGSISLDQHVGDFVPGIEGADKITIRDLLTERSGLPDINALPDYDDVLQHHQTPASLIAKIDGRPLLFEPGSKFLHEEHSAYNLLALIVEKKTGLPFAAAVDRSIFRPMGLTASGVDDDSMTQATYMAKGYELGGNIRIETGHRNPLVGQDGECLGVYNGSQRSTMGRRVVSRSSTERIVARSGTRHFFEGRLWLVQEPQQTVR